MVVSSRGENLTSHHPRSPAAGHAVSALLPLAFLLLTALADACTIGAFGPTATADGRVILWKNRDNDAPAQEIAVFTGPRFRFVADIDAGDTSNAWAGVNETGFAIIDANSLNLPGGSDDEDDDGRIILDALGTCASVDEFALMLDSLNLVGRATPVNYCAMDASGAASIFESSDTFYVRFDVAADTLGFMVRANYSLSGGVFNRLGHNRYRRAMQLCIYSLPAESLDARMIIQRLARDLGQVGFYPYPLPFKDSLDDLPRGFLPTDSTICRHRTRSAQVIVGPEPGAAPGQAMMWALLGPGEVALPIPVWAVADSIPEMLDGPGHAALCDKALLIHECLHSAPDHIKAVNSSRLNEMYERFAPVESSIFALVESCKTAWGPNGPNPAQACSVTATVCGMVMQAYDDFEQYIHWGAAPKEPAPRNADPQVESCDRVVPTAAAGPLPARVPVFDALGRRVAWARRPAGGRAIEPPAGLRSGAYFAVPVPGNRPIRLNVIH